MFTSDGEKMLGLGTGQNQLGVQNQKEGGRRPKTRIKERNEDERKKIDYDDGNGGW
jgi:hypothetical protein